jgi:transcriptional regulator with XRE-family HTH domain
MEQQIATAIAHNLKKCRKKNGLSQKEFAAKLDAHLTHINRVETGKYVPSVEFLARAAKFLGITIDALISESEDYAQDVRIEDKDLADRLRLLAGLDKSERDALITVMDSMLTKHRMRSLINNNAGH